MDGKAPGRQARDGGSEAFDGKAGVPVEKALTDPEAYDTLVQGYQALRKLLLTERQTLLMKLAALEEYLGLPRSVEPKKRS